MQIQSGSISLSPISGSGPQTLSMTVNMPAAVTHATAIITGFLVEFSHGDGGGKWDCRGGAGDHRPAGLVRQLG